MTLTVEDDFREFVVARWPDLEAVAFLVTLDEDAARRVTTDALAGLHHQWREALDEGRPGELARRAVLTGALSARVGEPPATSAGGRPGTPPDDPASALADGATAPHPGEHPTDDPVLRALTDTLHAATPVQRAVLAGRALWGAEPEEVAALLALPGADARDAADDLRGRLVAAHDRAREEEGLAPAAWALDHDLDDAVSALLRDQGDPPDPAALVTDRSRRVRRRSVVIGGLATTGVAAALWAVGRGATSGTPAAAPSAPATPLPGDPRWASTVTWPPRGALGTDDGVQALVIARTPPGSRLLWADEVGDRRIAVARLAGSPEGGTALRVWSGPRGAEPALLEEVPLTVSEIEQTDTSVAVVVPDGSGATGLVVMLASPRLLRCRHSASVVFTRVGGVRRRWTEVQLADGIGTSLVPGPPGPAIRVQVGRLDGAPAGTQRVTLGSGTGGDVAASLLSAAGPFATAATGPPRPGFTSEVVFEGVTPGDVIDPAAVIAQPREGRVAVVHTTTPEGAVLRSVRVRDDGRASAPYLDLDVMRPISPEDADRPFASPLPPARDEVGRFLVVAPGAAKAQLLAVTPSTFPSSRVTDLRDGVAVLEVVYARQAAIYRLVLWGTDGVRLGAWRQRFGRRDPNDLWPRFTT